MKLFTSIVSLFMIGAAAAQNPTILQGSYVSNVFGQSNFVKNPNAQTNTANVTLTTATATRSTTTPLVATTEWNVTITSANGTAAWATRTFDAGMKNQNCEARFTYRGFQATSKAQIKQGANVVAELVLTPSATDPRIASINFPCGDLSSATTFVITDTATLAGTNEIGGIYVGLATNQANVAQAETVVLAYTNAVQPITGGTYTTVINGDERLDRYGEYDNTTGIFTAKRAGYYSIQALNTIDSIACPVNGNNALNITKNNNVAATGSMQVDKYAESTSSYQRSLHVSGVVELAVGDTVRVQIYPCVSTNKTSNSFLNYMMITRFPSSSELVVTPETQNVWASAEWNDADVFQYAQVPEPTGFLPYTRSGSFTATYNGRAQAPLSSEVGFSVENLPVGKYELRMNQGLLALPGFGANTGVVCQFRMRETTTNTQVALGHQVNQYDPNFYRSDDGDRNLIGIFDNTSVGTRNFIFESNKVFDTHSNKAGQCGFSTNVLINQYFRPVVFTLIPLDTASNSALYVQGPLKAAGTGTAIPSGYVGQKIEENTNANGGSNTIAVNTSTNIRVLTIPPGVWLVCGAIGYDTSASTSPVRVISTLSKTSATNGTSGLDRVDSVSATIGQTAHTPPCAYENNSSNVTYYLTGFHGATSGTITIPGAFIRAIRLN